jgi:hypothetical protein
VRFAAISSVHHLVAQKADELEDIDARTRGVAPENTNRST